MNALILLVTGGVAVALILMGNRPALVIGWVFFGFVIDEVLLYYLLRRNRSVVNHLADLAEPLLIVLDAQADAISQQQREIASLNAIMTARQVRQQVAGTLDREVRPNLAALVDGLQQAESSLPDMLPQTRAWVASTRRLATQAQAHIEELGDEVTW